MKSIFAGSKMEKGIMNKLLLSLSLFVVVICFSFCSRPNSTVRIIDIPAPGNISWLHVDGKWLCDSSGRHIVLRGLDLIDLGVQQNDYDGIAHIINLVTDTAAGWYPNVLRLAIYPSGNDGDGGDIGGLGWTGEGADNYYNKYLKPATDLCIKKGLYFIIDWHAIDRYDGSGVDKNIVSWTNDFWDYISKKYVDCPNAIFELFNEPEYKSGEDENASPGTPNVITWAHYKPYAQGWVNIIRQNAPRNLILASSPNWTADIHEAVNDPLTGDPVAYTCHIYPDVPQDQWDSAFGIPSGKKPVVMTEWGYGTNCEPPVKGTQSEFGDPYKTYINAHSNIGWTYWCTNWDWEHDMFDSTWTLLGGSGNSGAFCKQWLYEQRNSIIQQ